MIGLEWYPCCRLQPATRIPLGTCYSETSFRITSTKCRINTVVSLDDGHIVAPNM